MTDQPPPPKRPLPTPEQLANLLRSDFKGTPPAAAKKPKSQARSLFWSAMILLAGIAYAIVKLSTSTATIIVVNATGEDAASVAVISGSRRTDVGPLGNGNLKTVPVIPGRPVEVEYEFSEKHTWKAPFAMTPFQSVRVTLVPGGKVQVTRGTFIEK